MSACSEKTRLAAAAALVLSVSIATAQDWPQFHGPRRDNRSSETGLLRRWPEGGPRLIWTAGDLGHGFAGVAIVAGVIYTTGSIDGRSVITAMDLSAAKLWQTANGPAYKRSHPGTRSTPSVFDGKLYHLSGLGRLACLDAASGSVLWTVDLMERFKGRMTRWGISESPLVDGDKVICTPGGEEVFMVALDRNTGQTIWTCTGVGEMAGYATATIVDYAGLRQVVTMSSHSAVGIDAATGKLLWKYPHKVPYEANIDTPLYHDGCVYLFGTWGRGATKLKLNVSGSACSVEQLWHTSELDNEHGGVMLIDGYLYGQADGDHKDRHWACLDAQTGRTMWTSPDLAGRASATLTFADGALYVLSDRGEVALVRPDPGRFEIVSRFDLPKGGKGEVRARPVVCGRRLYIRHGDRLYAYDIAGSNARR